MTDDEARIAVDTDRTAIAAVARVSAAAGRRVADELRANGRNLGGADDVQRAAAGVLRGCNRMAVGCSQEVSG